MEKINIPEPLASVVASCEVTCVAGCCGLDAFDIRPQWIRMWMADDDAATLALALQQIADLIEYLSVEERDVFFPILNEGGLSSFFVKVFGDWQVAIEHAPHTPLPEPLQLESPPEKFWRELKAALSTTGCIVGCAALVVGLIGLIYWLLRRL